MAKTFWRLRRPSADGLALAAILILAAVARLAAMPARHELRDVDEPDYLQGGLLLLEGLPPSFHYAPAGPETWFSWAYGGALSAKYFLLPTAEERAVPGPVRVYVAVNHAEFDLYRDMSRLRGAYASVAIVLSLLAVAAAFRLGRHWGGLPAAVLAGGRAGFTPLLVNFAVEGRPYSAAWSCEMIAVYFAAVQPRRRSAVWSGVFAGLAVASRIEMLLLLPLTCVMLWPGRTAGWRGVVRHAVTHAAVAAVTAVLVAPWLVTNLLGNLRAIATLRLGPAGLPTSLRQTLTEFAWG